jgi:hypothetical protein
MSINGEAADSSHVFRCLLIVLLCLGILLQILGASVSFWDLNGSDDPFTASVLLSYAVLWTPSVPYPLRQCFVAIQGTPSRQQYLHQQMLFRPPLSFS